MSTLNHEYRHYFVHVPKAAGTSMERMPFVGGQSHMTARQARRVRRGGAPSQPKQAGVPPYFPVKSIEGRYYFEHAATNAAWSARMRRLLEGPLAKTRRRKERKVNERS